MGGFFVLCEKPSSWDAHGLLLAWLGEAERVAVDLAKREQLNLGSVDVTERVRGWEEFVLLRKDRRLNKSLWNFAQYSLALLDHAGKREKPEVPVGIVAWGEFSGTEPLATFALVHGLQLLAPTKPRLCRWCKVGALGLGQATDSGCSDRCRKRKSRAERNSSGNGASNSAEQDTGAMERREETKA